MIRICIVDDHEVVRRGLRQILSEARDISVVEEASSGEEMLQKAQRRRWDAVVLDISMPGRGGLESLEQIKAQFPRLPVLVLTMHTEDQYALRALKLGADGYLTKAAAAETLADAIRRVAAGGKYVTPHLAELLASEIGSKRGELLHESLSDREYQVFGMLAKGRGVTEIARELGLSAKTVSTNRARLLQKLGLRNNAEIIHYALKHRLVEALPTP